MINGLNVTKPTLKNVFDNSKAEIFQTLNCVKVGTIVSFDSTKRTAEVQISFKRSLSIPIKDEVGREQFIVSYPLLVDCPVVTLQGGGAGAAFPIAAGDECLVFFADANIDAWFDNGGEALPFDGRRHDLSDGIALVGLNSLANTLSLALADDEAGVADDLAKVAIKNGKINVSNGVADFITAMDVFLTSLSGSADPTVAAAAPILKTSLDALFY